MTRESELSSYSRKELINIIIGNEALLERAKKRINELKHKRKVTKVKGKYTSKIIQVMDDEEKISDEKRIEVFDDKESVSEIIPIKSINFGDWYENYYYFSPEGKTYGEIMYGIVLYGGKIRTFTPITFYHIKQKRSALMSISNLKGYMGMYHPDIVKKRIAKMGITI